MPRVPRTAPWHTGDLFIRLIAISRQWLGDPTGHNESRPRLTRAEVEASAQTYITQAFKVLDRDPRSSCRRNSEWLDAMTHGRAVR